MAGRYTTADSTAPAYRAAAVTPHDTNTIEVTRGLYIGASGNVTVKMVGGGDNILFTSVPIGVLPIQVIKVYSTGTAATGIVALY